MAAAPTGAAAPEWITPYPEGHWRTVESDDLRQVALWVSHILIRHRESRMMEPVLHPAAQQFGTPPDRSKEEAWNLATELSARARAAPDQFAELARQYSEDRSTVAAGGSLGGVPALQLLRYPQVLDALQAVHAGEVSEVVETSLGFHVFFRRAPPPQATVSGARIVIAHDEAPFLRELTPESKPYPHRSRAEALQLAHSVFEQAKGKPASFARLVQRYSEHQDLATGGDIGTWSTREPSVLGREIELLSQLKVGQVAPPIDSLFGFEILQRTPDRARPELAMSAVQVDYTSGLLPNDNPQSREQAAAQAKELSRQLAKDPHRFAALQAEHCCTDPEQFLDGRGPAEVSKALLGLKIGQIAREPVRDATRFLIVQRIEPQHQPAAPILFELP